MVSLKNRLPIKYFMVFYLGLLLLFSSLYFKDLKMFGSSLLIVLLYSLYDLFWTYVRDRVWYLPVSSWISGFVLAIVALPNPRWIFIILLPLLAVATKQMLHFGKNRHVFNPASSALAIVGIFTPIAAWWAVAAAQVPSLVKFNLFDPAVLLFIFIVLAALIILWKQNRWHITGTFLLVYAAAFSVLSVADGVTINLLPRLLSANLLTGVVLFFATVMLVEPLTSIFVNKKQEIFYAALVAVAAVVMTYLTRTFNLFSFDPLVYGLLVGNLVASLWFLPARNAGASVAGGLGKEKQKKCVHCSCGKEVAKISDEPSYWFRDVPATARFPTLKGDNNFDAVVVGGGMAGVSAAYFLSKAGVKVAVVEAGTIGSGDSGYSTACATRFLENIDATLKAWEASDVAISLFKKTIVEEKINCDWQDIDAFCFTKQTDKKSLADFSKTFNRLKEKDSGFEVLDKDKASRALGVGISQAYRRHNSDGIFHIRKFLLALAEKAVKNGAVFFENSEVTDISLGDTINLKTKEGGIVTEKLIVATGIPSNKFFSKVASLIRSSISYVIDIKFSGQPPLRNGFFCDDLDPYHYFRSVGESEFLLGGEDWFVDEPKPKGNPHEKLETWLRDLAGEKNQFNIINSWQGSIFSTADTLPLVGPHSAYGNNVIFLTGWAGNGTAQGFFGGSIAADLVMNKTNSFQTLFACDRTLVWPKNNKTNISIMKKDKKFANLQEDKGEVVELEGKKVAVVKTGGKVQTFSAVCPHLGCTIGWNDDAKTWDCPCHGSRFNKDGSLLHGPAKRGLDPAGVELADED